MITYTVPFIDLKRQHSQLSRSLREAVLSVLESGIYVGGEQLERFEHNFATFCDAKHCVGVANGTDALTLSLEALGVGPRDEVILPACSFFATAEAISRVGARPVFCDINPFTATIDIPLLESIVTSRTKALIPVHLYGQPVAMDELLEVAQKHGLYVVEDCAQAAGARFEGQHVGTFGDIGCFSFYPTKNLGALGDSGAIVTNDAKLAQKVRMLANHGGLRKYEHRIVGLNSRLDTIQAAVLNVKLSHLDQCNEQRRAIAAQYDKLLDSIHHVEKLKRGPNCKHAFHLYVVRLAHRDEVLANLQEAGIGVDVHYPQALPFVPAYRSLGHGTADFPAASDHAARSLSLPIFPYMREDEITTVVEYLLAACRK